MLTKITSIVLVLASELSLLRLLAACDYFINALEEKCSKGGGFLTSDSKTSICCELSDIIFTFLF